MSHTSSEELIGSTLLIGLDRYDHEGNPKEPQQSFGRVIQASEEGGIVVSIDEGHVLHLPPDFDAIYLSPSGSYRWTATGETIDDPDYIAMWRVESLPPPETSARWRPLFAPIANRTINTFWDFEYRYDADRLRSLIEERQATLVGKTIIVGLTIYEKVGEEENFVEQKQVHGTITHVSFGRGIVIALASGEEHTLPPDVTMVQPAPPGEYHLRSTGGVLIDPDYLAAWALTRKRDG